MIQRDFLAIGDTVVDAFIRISDAEVIKKDNGDQMLAVRYGDKVPYDSVEVCNAVGNSANAAVSAARLGLNSALLTYLGDDTYGKDCIAELTRNNVATEYVRTETGKKTNYHYVLWYDVDRTILIKHEHFTYDLGDIVPPKWIYLSSLGDNTVPFQMQIADFVESHPETKLAFQPGTFQIKLGTEVLAKVYKNTEVFFCNVEEAQHILGEKSRDLRTLMTGIAKFGPKKVVITDGFDGAYAFDSEDADGAVWFMPVYPHTPLERTGAGDAFASTVISALELGKPLHEALTWGPINSMSVVQQVGAQKGLLSREKLEEFLANAPVEYVLKKI